MTYASICHSFCGFFTGNQFFKAPRAAIFCRKVRFIDQYELAVNTWYLVLWSLYQRALRIVHLVSAEDEDLTVSKDLYHLLAWII